MSRLNQPINQVRLTNVAVVRLTTHGKRFELACYRNKVMNWRSGVETDIDEVLQTDAIFTNVSKGQVAKQKDLEKIFGTVDKTVICRRILDKGEMQVSEKERDAFLESMFRDVTNLVAAKCVSPITGLPLTTQMIEGALKELGFNVNLSDSAKKQALKAIDLLKSAKPNEVSRSMMNVRLSCEQQQIPQVQKFLAQIHVRNLQQSTDGVSDAPVTAGSGVDGEAASGEAATATIVCQFACDPSLYRMIDAFVTGELVPPGALMLMAARSDDPAADRPAAKRVDSQPSGDAEPPAAAAGNSAPPATPPAPVVSGQSVAPTTGGKFIVCGTCQFQVPAAEYRQHCKKEWHTFNVKRKFKSLPPLTQEAFELVAEDIRMGFLTVDY